MRLSENEPVLRHRVVIVGGGFGGLQAALRLRRAPVDVTLIDRRNFHLFQPLLYQVAAGAVSAAEIAQPLRSIFRRQRNVSVVLGEVSRFDLERRRVLIDGAGGSPAPVPYDTLIVAAGSRYVYFGHDEWRPFAPEIKTLEGALDTRRRILRAFEAAELEHDPARRAAWLTFVVVGAGPTGVEIAGQIGEIARETLRRDFRAIDPREARILIVDRAERVLATFPPSLSAKAERALERLGIEPLLSRTVVGIDDQGVTLQPTAGTRDRVPARTTIWAAGVGASPLAGMLA
jgi:NADH:ubiquinone reductase (H+-translocating)